MLLIETLWRRRRTRDQFRRRLRRAGLPEDVIKTVADRYHEPGLIRSLFREVWSSDEGDA